MTCRKILRIYYPRTSCSRQWAKLANPAHRGLPSSVGLRAHIRLAKISGHIVCNTYRIACNTWADANPATGGASHVDKAMKMLSDWLGNLPNELRMSYETFSQDRPLCTLHMSHNQVRLLQYLSVYEAGNRNAH